MPSRDVGERLKELRRQRQLTLKAIEAEAGVSATHISEIERGRSSPTLSSLAKIAGALHKDVSFFLEEETLDEVCQLSVEGQPYEDLPWGGGRMKRLTRLIPGARLSAYQLWLEQGGPSSSAHHHEGNEIYFVQSGQVRFEVNEKDYELDEGDAIHIQAEKNHRYQNVGTGEARMLFFTTRRHML